MVIGPFLSLKWNPAEDPGVLRTGEGGADVCGLQLGGGAGKLEARRFLVISGLSTLPSAGASRRGPAGPQGLLWLVVASGPTFPGMASGRGLSSNPGAGSKLGSAPHTNGKKVICSLGHHLTATRSNVTRPGF